MAQNHYALIYDGVKAEPLSMSAILGTQDDVSATPAEAYALVAYTNRGVGIRADLLSALPWSISRGETTLATNQDYQDDQQFDWLGDMTDLLWSVEASLSVTAVAYVHKEVNAGRQPIGLRYMAPYTITTEWNLSTFEVAFFRRAAGMQLQNLPPDDVVYFRLPNYAHETNPAQSPVGAALSDSGVVINLNRFAQTFFQRGAIRTTILHTEGHPNTADKERMRSEWRRTITGMRNWFDVAIMGKAVQPTIIGDGLDTLNNDSLSGEKREAIATALGIPHSMLFSNATTYATAEADRQNFYELTGIPESRRVASTLNEQLFAGMGLKFKFHPENLPIFKSDESENADAYSVYVAAGMLPSVAAEMLGMTMPDGVEYADLDPDENQRVIDITPIDAAPQIAVRSAEWVTESRQFKSWIRSHPNSDIGKFKAHVLTDTDKLVISDSIKADTVKPRGKPLAPVDADWEITEADIRRSIADWDERMPSYKGLLDAEVV